ncbi:anti-sigma factor family protein [Lentzea kentuckyensis]|uniref:anti-sigma factor family protein n=1 Tax=Lentzea kentuckyensis TaxID=360086 RepID=UPI000A3D1DAA|nr:zf-HC2 domain-containing protein [Lentzea kentuckyensis]
MCPFREWDVAYLLGSLSPGDQQVYERHLAACPPCEHEVCRMAGTAGLLSRVPAEWVEKSLEPDAESPPRRRLLVTATVLAAVLVAVLVFVRFRSRDDTS